jgi:anti-sigma B factor antagonist
MALKISVMSKDDGVVILCLVGSLDTETHTELEVRGRKELDKSPKGMILDFKSLDYISSMGISALLLLQKQAQVRGVSLVVTNIPPQIDEVFKIVKALPQESIFASMEEADRYLLGIQKKIKEDQQ